MRLKNITLAGIVLLVLAFTASTGMADNSQTTATPTVTATPASIVTGIANAATTASDEEEAVEDIEEYKGSVGPGSSLYGLKLAFDRLDEGFTFKEREKIQKKIDHASERLAEAKAELRKKNNEAVIRALAEYRAKLNDVDNTVNTVSEASEEDTGLLNAQRMIAKHEAVLEALLELHPNNTGLARAYNNSLELQEKFGYKTGREFVLATRNGKKVLRGMDIDETKEKLKIKAKVIDNATQVEVVVRFASNSTDSFAIAQEIVNRLQLSEENINSIIKIEREDEEEDYKLKEKLEAKAEVKGAISKVEAQYRFPLDKTNDSDIVKGVHQKLSALTQADVLKVLETKVKEGRKETEENDETLKIKAKVIDNATQVEVDVKFASGSTDNFTIAQEIVSRLQLSEENINSIIKVEKEDEDQGYKLKEELEAKAEVKGTTSKIEAKYRFPLDKTNESEIIQGIHEKLSALTSADILNILEMKAKEGRKEIQEKEKKQENKGREEIAGNVKNREKKEQEEKED